MNPMKNINCAVRVLRLALFGAWLPLSLWRVEHGWLDGVSVGDVAVLMGGRDFARGVMRGKGLAEVSKAASKVRTRGGDCGPFNDDNP